MKLKAGDRVRVKGIEDDNNNHCFTVDENGRTGTVVEVHDSGAWNVDVDIDDRGQCPYPDRYLERIVEKQTSHARDLIDTYSKLAEGAWQRYELTFDGEESEWRYHLGQARA